MIRSSSSETSIVGFQPNDTKTMNHLTRRSFVKHAVAGSLAAANMIVLTGIVQADGGGGGTTTTTTTSTGVINPCENPSGGREAYCTVQVPGDPIATNTDICEHNGQFYFCMEGQQAQNSWLKSQCDEHGNCHTGSGPIIP